MFFCSSMNHFFVFLSHMYMMYICHKRILFFLIKLKALTICLTDLACLAHFLCFFTGIIESDLKHRSSPFGLIERTINLVFHLEFDREGGVKDRYSRCLQHCNIAALQRDATGILRSINKY